MKRKSESLQSGSVLKTPKYSHDLTLISLPTEVLQMIFSHLTRQDIINLSTLDYNFRKRLVPLIFSEIQFTWKKIIQRDNDFFEKYKYFINQARISDSNALHEWNYDVFTELLINLPNLKHLLINSESSSNWLKYRQHDNIKQLTLYCSNHVVGLYRQTNKELDISITQGKLTSSLNRLMVSRFMNTANFPHLLKLRLCGWNTTYNISNWFSKLPENNVLQILELKPDSELDDKEKAYKECVKYFP
ncbi:hypothetical protein K6H10_002898 [Candida tropicalis]